MFSSGFLIFIIIFMRLFTASIVVLFVGLFGKLAFADSFSHYPDSTTFNPSQGQTTVTMNIYAFYNGDTTNGPGTTVHAWISTGSTYFRVDTVPHHFKSYWYWTITYYVQSSQVTGYVSLSDDTVTQRIKLIGKAAPDGVLTGYGPYFTMITKMDSTSCTSLRLINNGSHRDTIIAASWSHNPNGIFTWDTTNVPSTIGSHDTAYWTFCFHAPHDTLIHTDTFNIAYHDSTGQNKYLTRIVSAQASGSTPDADLSVSGPYFTGITQMDSTTCSTMRIVNAGADRDTITSLVWSHNPNGIFTYDTTITLPRTLGSHDTLLWSFCFHAPHDTNYHIDTLTVYYKDAMSSSRSISRVVYGRAAAPSPDAEISGYGPYFPTTKEGSSNCTHLRLINNGSDVDTIVSVGWAHNPNGIFTYDTAVTVPHILHSHDTLLWNFCFHAPNDTNYHVDTFVVNYRDGYSQTRSISRVVAARAVDSSSIDCYYLYAPTVKRTEVGDTSYIHVFIANRLDSTVTLTAIHISGSGDAAYRVDSSTFPHTIAGQHYDSVWVAFIPYAGATSFPATLTGTFTVDDTMHCKTATASLNGTAAYFAHDTSSINFNDTGTATVNMSGDSGHLVHRIEFVNNSSVSLLVHSITLSNTNHFYLAQILPGTPDTVLPGAKISALIYFYGDSSGTTYNDTIVVTIEHALTSFYVYVSGHSVDVQQQSGVASAMLNAGKLRIYPNPSQGLTTISIDGSAQARFDVLDLLGHAVAHFDGAPMWQWNADALAAGTYYVRAQSGDFIETRRIVIVK